MMAQKRGAFILLEGVDRCGKTTQCKKLLGYLQTLGDAEFLRFPDRETTIGRMINSYLQNSCDIDDRTVHLLFSANRWEAASKLEKMLKEGKNVVVDRYSYSGVAFSAAKNGLDISWCYAPERGLPKPDAIIFLDLPIEKAMQRGDFGNERYEKKAFQESVRRNFFSLIEHEKSLWHVLDASDSIDRIAEKIRIIAQQTINMAQTSPLKYLD